MPQLDQLRALARTESPPAGVPTAALGKSDGERAIEAVLRYFGDDDARTAVTLVIEGECVGHLRREDVFQLVHDATRDTLGGWGSSAGACLPGHPQYELLRLLCPIPDCPKREQLRMTYDEDNPPHCSVHPGTALELL